MKIYDYEKTPFSEKTTYSPLFFEFYQQLESVGLLPEKLQRIHDDLHQFLFLVSRYFRDENIQKEILKTLLYMFFIHKNQKDKANGTPFIGHPILVCLRLFKFGVRDPQIIEEGLLHDTVEDQGVIISRETLEKKYGKIENPEVFEDQNWELVRQSAVKEIKNQYGRRVSKVVQNLSNPDYWHKAVKKGIDPQTNKEEYRKLKFKLNRKHVKEIINDPDVFVVKLADFLTNALHIHTYTDPDKRKKYKDKYLPIFPIFIQYLKNGSLPYEIQNREKVLWELEEAYERVKQM